MRRPALVSCAALASLALTALPSTALAQRLQPWTFRLEAGAGTTIRDFDHSDVNTTIDGSWSYGDAAPDHDDWDLALQPGEQDAALDSSFSDPSHFCP